MILFDVNNLILENIEEGFDNFQNIYNKWLEKNASFKFFNQNQKNLTKSLKKTC